MTSDAVATTDGLRGLAWAVYLGVSWTWVIGMFLPVLLIRDFGPVAWFIFAIPNVLGAAAMGWVIRSRDHSLRFVVRHRAATQAFSIVTIAFHLFFIVWMVSRLAGAVVSTAAFGLALAVMLPLLVTGLQQTVSAMLVLGASLLIAMLAAGQGSLGWPRVEGGGSAFDLFGLAAVSFLGFLTCPYLDLTFHRARQACRTREESKLAFGVGFGVVFFSMIIFTLLYAWALLVRPDSRAFTVLIGLHIAIQAIFTIGVHASALRATSSTPREHSRMTSLLWVAAIGAAGAALLARWLEVHGSGIGRMGAGEVIYRLFMSFYGLVTPAYAWLCVHPGRGFLPPHRRELQMFVLAVVVAAPFYWLGFIHGPMGWVVVGVAIILCARFLLDYTRRDLLAEGRMEMLNRGERP